MLVIFLSLKLTCPSDVVVLVWSHSWANPRNWLLEHASTLSWAIPSPSTDTTGLSTVAAPTLTMSSTSTPARMRASLASLSTSTLTYAQSSTAGRESRWELKSSGDCDPLFIWASGIVVFRCQSLALVCLVFSSPLFRMLKRSLPVLPVQSPLPPLDSCPFLVPSSLQSSHAPQPVCRHMPNQETSSRSLLVTTESHTGLLDWCRQSPWALAKD